MMMNKKEEEQTIPDDSSQTAKASQELREEVIKKYAQVFTGLGRLEKPYHIEVDPTVTPPPPPPPPHTHTHTHPEPYRLHFGRERKESCRIWRREV